jgi:hypothetical protein
MAKKSPKQPMTLCQLLTKWAHEARRERLQKVYKRPQIATKCPNINYDMVKTPSVRLGINP